MKEYIKKPKNQSRTLDSNPEAAKQASISEVLQANKNGTSRQYTNISQHVIQRIPVGIRDLDTDNPKQIWNYFNSILSDHKLVHQLLDALREKEAPELAEEILKEFMYQVAAEECEPLEYEYPPFIPNEELALRDLYLVGEGDFSYSASLADTLPKTTKATSYDSRTTVEQKYPTAAGHLEKLKLAGIDTAHEVDATDLEGTSSPRPTRRIVFNFPHTGIGAGSSKEQRTQSIQSNRELLRNFFRSAREKVIPGGEIEMMLKSTSPYTEWDVEAIAREEGWILISREPVAPGTLPPAYQHVETRSGERVATTGRRTAIHPPYKYIFRKQGIE